MPDVSFCQISGQNLSKMFIFVQIYVLLIYATVCVFTFKVSFAYLT